MNEKLIILSIDPGYDRCGWAIGAGERGNYQVINYNLIQTVKKNTIFQRFAQIQKELTELIELYKPTHLAIETLFFAKNTTTAMRVSEVRGMIIGLAIAKGLEIFEYDPSQIKSTVTGNGAADKAAVAKMVFAQLKMNPSDLSQKKLVDDAVDALAIGMTHAATHRY